MYIVRPTIRLDQKVLCCRTSCFVLCALCSVLCALCFDLCSRSLAAAVTRGWIHLNIYVQRTYNECPRAARSSAGSGGRGVRAAALTSRARLRPLGNAGENHVSSGARMVTRPTRVGNRSLPRHSLLQRLSRSSGSAGLGTAAAGTGTGTDTGADSDGEGRAARGRSGRRRFPRSLSRSPSKSRSRSRSRDRKTRLQGRSSGAGGSGDKPLLPQHAAKGSAKAQAQAGPGPARRKRRGSQNHNNRDRNRKSSQQELLPLFGLDIPESRVHLVDTPERLEAAGAILGKSVVLSIDTETQPSFKMGEWHPTSLLQIATRFVDLT